jgi:hypothetical protein
VNYGEIKTYFTSILNRRDITASQIELFLQLGLKRIQRTLRIPAMEKVYPHTSDGTGIIPIPTDFLEIISISMNDSAYSYRLIKSDLQTVLAQQLTLDYPKFYYRSGASWLIGPKANSGLTINVVYYGDFGQLTSDSSVNWLTTSCPDALIYGALTFSSDHFLDNRATTFEQRFLGIMEELMLQANQDELQNASISIRDLDYAYGPYSWSPGQP